jgi:hypothetical protein
VKEPASAENATAKAHHIRFFIGSEKIALATVLI